MINILKTEHFKTKTTLNVLYQDNEQILLIRGGINVLFRALLSYFYIVAVVAKL